MQAHISYTGDTGETLVNETFGPNNIRRRTTGSRDCTMEVRDGRGALIARAERLRAGRAPHGGAELFDADELKKVYYPEVEQLIRERARAPRVVVFDHTLRSGNEAEREARLIREPVLSAHNDYTEWSGPQRVREIMGDEAERCSRAASPSSRSGAPYRPADPSAQPARPRRCAQRRA